MAQGLIKQIRQAVNYLNPEEVRHDAEHPLAIALYAPTPDALLAMESYFCPPTLSQAKRAEVLEILHSNRKPDIEVYDSSMQCPRGAFIFDAMHPDLCMRTMLKRNPELELSLARHLQPFRDPVVKNIIQRISKENALF
jgi:hypothetical protein